MSLYNVAFSDPATTWTVTVKATRGKVFLVFFSSSQQGKYKFVFQQFPFYMIIFVTFISCVTCLIFKYVTIVHEIQEFLFIYKSSRQARDEMKIFSRKLAKFLFRVMLNLIFSSRLGQIENIFSRNYEKNRFGPQRLYYFRPWKVRKHIRLRPKISGLYPGIEY